MRTPPPADTCIAMSFALKLAAQVPKERSTMKRMFWAVIVLSLAAGCASQQLAWDDPYMQATTGPQPPTSQRVSGP